MSNAVRLTDLHLLGGFILAVPQSRMYHKGLPTAVTGSITLNSVIPFCCLFYCGYTCCIPNISIGTSKVYINGLPAVKAGNICVPCGTPAVSFQSQFNIV